MGIFYVFVLLSLTTIVSASTPEKIRWTRDLVVGNGYHIRWNNEDADYLTMEMYAPVKGYVAVGFSPNGAMRGSDIAMGWVDSRTGEAHLKDLYAVGNSPPLEDDKDDYVLLSAVENEFGTTVRFRRKWNTCDAAQDFEINEDTVRLIWAVSDDDPVRDEIFQPAYHQVDFRGGRSVFLKMRTHLTEFPDDLPVPDPAIHFWDVRMNNAPVDGETDTTYYCKIFKAPQFKDMAKKHQIIGYRTLFEEANEQWIHHIHFYECSVPPYLGPGENVFEKYLDHPGGQCYTRNMPPEWGDYCISVPFVWTAGAEGLMLPKHGGIPLHEHHNGTTYFMLEMHYDNPKQIQFKDSSGVRVFITEKTRENDFGTLDVRAVFGQFQMIPPKATGFKNMAYCTSECTQSVFPPEGITASHATLHGHLTATKLILRHIRDGIELPPIAQESHYDFNYQQSRLVSPEKKILPGDIIMMECEYDTEDRDGITYGGTSTRDEMCQGFVTYYPKIPLAVCRTQHEFHNFFDALGIQSVEGEMVLKKLQLPFTPKPNQLYDPGDDAFVLKNGTQGKPEYPFDVLYVTNPRPSGGKLQTVRQFVDELKWTKNDGALTKKVWKQWWEGQHVAYCTGPSFRRIPLKNYLVKYPEYVPYEKPSSLSCPKYLTAGGNHVASGASNLIFLLAGYLLAIY